MARPGLGETEGNHGWGHSEPSVRWGAARGRHVLLVGPVRGRTEVTGPYGQWVTGRGTEPWGLDLELDLAGQVRLGQVESLSSLPVSLGGRLVI